jgi:hypothetical protein
MLIDVDPISQYFTSQIHPFIMHYRASTAAVTRNLMNARYREVLGKALTIFCTSLLFKYQ